LICLKVDARCTRYLRVSRNAALFPTNRDHFAPEWFKCSVVGRGWQSRKNFRLYDLSFRGWKVLAFFSVKKIKSSDASFGCKSTCLVGNYFLLSCTYQHFKNI